MCKEKFMMSSKIEALPGKCKIPHVSFWQQSSEITKHHSPPNNLTHPSPNKKLSLIGDVAYILLKE